MRTRSMELMVGIFMVLGFAALAGLALNVSGLKFSASKGSYPLYARFENIGGLTPRAKVTLSGVQIGEVTAITIDKQRMMAVVELAIHADVDYLSADSSAQILTAGLLGEQYIGISVGFEEQTLKGGDYIADTQSAMVLEDLIGKFLFNKVNQ